MTVDTLPAPDERLFLLPVQATAVEGGIMLRRGSVRLHVGGDGAATVIETILDATSEGGASEEEILARFDPSEEEAVSQLVAALRARRILAKADDAPEAEETAFEIFAWDFNARAADLRERAVGLSVAVLGVNDVGMALVDALAGLGVSVTLLDHPLQRAQSYSGVEGDLVIARDPAPVPLGAWLEQGHSPDLFIATSDFGGWTALREWNAWAAQEGLTYLPVMLQDYTGYAGPLAVPGQTACLECFWMRQNSNLDDPVRQRGDDGAAALGQAVTGRIPLSATMLGQVAAFEAYRFLTRVLPGWRPNSVVELDLIETSMTRRSLLRAPRCPVCGPRARHGDIALQSDVELPGNAL